MMSHITKGSRSGMGKIPESLPQAFSPGRSGGLDMLTKRCREAEPRWHSRANWRMPIVWLGPSISTPSSMQGLAFWLPLGTFDQGWALVGQGQYAEGISRMRQGITGLRATGSQLGQSGLLRTLAEAVARLREIKEGLCVLDEACTVARHNGEEYDEVELWRAKGELTLAQVSVQRLASGVQAHQQAISTGQQGARGWWQEARPSSPQAPRLTSHAASGALQEAEGCFLHAIEIARRQSAKSLELRAVMNLRRLWQSQGRREEARQILAEMYGWFADGFDTEDLQEAKALLAELGCSIRPSDVR